ncbi:hypothetical protein OCC_13845 [Thermococcus litoralis DSM 5473]|uniref:dolichyl-phosphooligosaccharide-protein glycotransferase n=1 Tax=Thermococcus litoralis (strain ATCC 51850 / DSM 5473 / JCM 8560 / NS-C) TaxID=523849 RepID=S5ZB10_THELN|nr:STT3 domain-containing protein [Thermococcus litoralis]AGT34253.1 hypothetical protein OCC_13845 [Thermococcus litoralis DSM 5473]
MLNSLFKPKRALPLVIGVALILRLIPLRFKYLLGYDPYFHLAYIEEALKAGEWFNFFPFANGPWGFQIKTFHPLGLWITPAYVYKILKIFGVSLYNAFRITPVIFGVLTIAFFYWALLKFYDEKRAFFASLFLAVSYGHIFRSMANYYRGDNYMLFWYTVALVGIAYAFHTSERLGNKRLAFYLVPALASGFTAIFWQAYYPIFVFLLLNGVFLSVGVFILDKKQEILDSALLIISTAFGAFIANFLGSKFGYGMLGYDKPLGNSIAERLGVEFGLIKDSYLLFHIYYLTPVALALVLLFFLLSRFIKDRRMRIAIVGVLGFSAMVFVLVKFSGLREFFGVFEMFEGVPIMETRPTAFSDIWRAFSISFFLIPLFFLRFFTQKLNTKDFFFLGLIIPGLYLLLIWARFVFIGSLAVAFMVGIGLVEAYEFIVPKITTKTAGIVLIILILLPAVSGAFALDNVLNTKPLMNEQWEKALRWLGENSNENDVILAWWDYGTWITYYARRSPVAELAPHADVALYYLGKLDENWAMSLGVDYVVVSYYDFLKFGAVVDTAKMNTNYNIRETYGLVVLPMTSSIGTLVFERGGYRVIAKPGEEWNVLINADGRAITPRGIYVEYKGEIIRPNLTSSNSNAYLYINLNYKYAVLMNEEAFNTTLVKLFIWPEEPYELVYSDGGVIKILKLKHPNVEVERANGRVIFHFENATGTGLGIWGFLDNGTKVFEKWYPVKGLEEFELPSEVNGTVIRYAYAVGKKIVDRGVFRRE